jgi:NAD(P)-dependent dehydrogenase (short-subunit alcohol dehydrogenase family)
MNALGKLGFYGKSVLITGGCSGMGAATARLAAARGAKVMIASPNPDKLKQVADEITSSGGVCRWVVCDIRNESQVKDMVQATVDAFGGLDAAYNNAGIAHGPIRTHEVPQELWDRVLAVNVTGTYYCCREELKVFVAQGRGGTIVINGSMAGITGVASMTPYVASKHALAGMAKALAVEYGQFGIRVNFQGPGATDTAMMEQAIKDVTVARKAFPDNKAPSKIQGPLLRNQTAEEQAEVACFLLSDASSAMTGAIVIADCGATAY